GMGGLFAPDDLDLFTVLASYTAFAIERVNLTQSIYEMFEGVVRLSVRAIDARDPSTAGHSERVAEFTVRLAQEAHHVQSGVLTDVRFEPSELKELRYAALLHDFGKIGVRESVLMKGARLGAERLDAVLERFESARANLHADAYREAYEKGEAASWSLREAREYALKLSATRIAELNLAEELIVDHQSGRPIEPDKAALIRNMGTLTFRDTSGRERTLLSADDIENMTVPRGTLNESEWKDMRSHARRSEELLEQIPWSSDLKRIPCFAGMHHEKLNGTGYPQGLNAEDIPPQVRIMTIADIFDAMTAADRSYRKAASVERAVQVLVDEAKSGLLDTHLVSLFARDVVPDLVARQLVGATTVYE
ncbi:MAG: response regulator RpfG family c-di-GMP phosphodiesterase, partial [Bradymonadia bacterium]